MQVLLFTDRADKSPKLVDLEFALDVCRRVDPQTPKAELPAICPASLDRADELSGIRVPELDIKDGDVDLVYAAFATDIHTLALKRSYSGNGVHPFVHCADLSPETSELWARFVSGGHPVDIHSRSLKQLLYLNPTDPIHNPQARRLYKACPSVDDLDPSVDVDILKAASLYKTYGNEASLHAFAARSVKYEEAPNGYIADKFDRAASKKPALYTFLDWLPEDIRRNEDSGIVVQGDVPVTESRLEALLRDFNKDTGRILSADDRRRVRVALPRGFRPFQEVIDALPPARIPASQVLSALWGPPKNDLEHYIVENWPGQLIYTYLNSSAVSYMLLLHGQQRIGKDLGIKTLFEAIEMDDYRVEARLDQTKELAMASEGKVLVHLPEFGGIDNVKSSALIKMIVTNMPAYRKPYETLYTRAKHVPMLATINPTEASMLDPEQIAMRCASYEVKPEMDPAELRDFAMEYGPDFWASAMEESHYPMHMNAQLLGLMVEHFPSDPDSFIHQIIGESGIQPERVYTVRQVIMASGLVDRVSHQLTQQVRYALEQLGCRRYSTTQSLRVPKGFKNPYEVVAE